MKGMIIEGGKREKSKNRPRFLPSSDWCEVRERTGFRHLACDLKHSPEEVLYIIRCKDLRRGMDRLRIWESSDG